jgi:hypothetical protein
MGMKTVLAVRLAGAPLQRSTLRNFPTGNQPNATENSQIIKRQRARSPLGDDRADRARVFRKRHSEIPAQKIPDPPQVTFQRGLVEAHLRPDGLALLGGKFGVVVIQIAEVAGLRVDEKVDRR